MPDPAVTVALATHNQERYVDDALSSLCAQTSREFEVVVVDDASTDGTVGRIRHRLPDLPVPARLVVNERNLGLSASKNRNWRELRGEFVCWFGADDVCEPHRIERQLACFRECDDRVAAVFADMRFMTDDGVLTGQKWFEVRPLTEGAIFDALILENFIPAPAVMVRRSVVDEVGGLDDTLFVDDWDLWLRIADRFDFRFVDDCLVRYRLSPGGVSRSPAYAARMLDGCARTLIKWHGRDPVTDAQVAHEAWALARRAVAKDPPLGRAALRAVYEVAPSPGRRLQVAGASLAGAPTLLRGLFALHDARKARAGIPGRGGGSPSPQPGGPAGQP